MHDQGSPALSGTAIPTVVTPQFAGQLYINTSTGYVYIANSVTTGDWYLQKLTTVATAPKAADFSSWTWQNQGSATLTDGELGVARMYIPGSASNSFRHIAKAVPAAPYQLTVQFTYNGDAVPFRHGFIGWKVALTATDKLEMHGYNWSDGGVATVWHKWGNETSYSSEGDGRVFIEGHSAFFRIKESGGNIYVYYSENRNSWHLIESYAKGAKYLGAGEYNYLFIGGNQSGTSNPFYMDITYFKLESL
jgi:hypothetical protein